MVHLWKCQAGTKIVIKDIELHTWAASLSRRVYTRQTKATRSENKDVELSQSLLEFHPTHSSWRNATITLPSTAAAVFCVQRLWVVEEAGQEIRAPLVCPLSDDILQLTGEHICDVPHISSQPPLTTLEFLDRYGDWWQTCPTESNIFLDILEAKNWGVKIENKGLETYDARKAIQLCCEKKKGSNPTTWKGFAF